MVLNQECRRFGYARISTKQQNIERQIRNLLAVDPSLTIKTEIFTGTRQDRPVWKALKKSLKAGDTVFFDSVSRMSRNAEEGVAEYMELFDRGVELVFLKEPHINTTVYRDAREKAVPLTGTSVDFILEGINRYLMALAREQIFLAFAQSEKEVTDLHERTREGIITARNNGKQIGRPAGRRYITQKERSSLILLKKHSKDFGGSLNDAECMKLLGISRNTFYRYKKKLSEVATDPSGAEEHGAKE